MTPQRRLTRVTVAGAVIALTVSTAAQPADAAPAATTTPTYLCSDLELGIGTQDVLDDVFAWGVYRDRVGDGRGDIDWRADPHDRVSWRMWLNALRWLGQAVRDGRDGDVQARDHALAIAHDWVRDHQADWTGDVSVTEGTMHRTNMLLCLRQTVASSSGRLPAQHAWLDTAIARHGAWLASHYSGIGNHGTNESITLLGVGVTLRKPAYTSLAVARLREALPVTIDGQGATDEQATGYVLLNYDLWTRARATLVAAQTAPDLQRSIGVSLRRLATFLAHATNSQGYHHQIGDSERRRLRPLVGTPHEYIATAGGSGTPPKDRVAIYRAGYVFGRSGWGTGRTPLARESAYSLRFGPARRGHGHHDKTSITYHARGRDVLIDPGVGETTRDAWDAYFKGFDAHNALVAPGMAVAPALLTSSSLKGIADVYTVTDKPGRGFTRSRTAAFLRGPDAVLVVDRATAPRTTTFSQHWHLPSDASVRVSRNVATAKAGPEATTIVPLRVGKAATGSLRLARGATRPVQGWHWHTIFNKRPAPTVTGTLRGQSVTTAAVVLPTAATDRIRVRTTVSRAGTTTWTIQVGTQRAVVGHRSDGTVFRVR